MRILLDTRNLSLQQGTGIATYARNLSFLNAELGNSVDLLYEFRRQSQTDAILDEVSFYDMQFGSSAPRFDKLTKFAARALWPRLSKTAKPINHAGFVDNRAVRATLPHFDRILFAPLVYRNAWSYFSVTGRFLRVIADPLPDIAHWTAPFPIYVSGAKNVYTIHDVIPLKLPFSTTDNKKRYRRLIRNVVAIADQLITVSDTSRRDLVALEPDAEQKTINTFQSVRLPPETMAISDDENAQTIDNLLGLTSRKFFIFYAAIEPKKNLGRLMEAYLGSNSPYPLVVVGRKGWLADPELRPLLYEDVKTSLTGSKGRIVQLDYVSSELLVTLVRSARAVLFPSIYEGFGLPILESMMCGTPVMTANFGAMREVATAEAALLIDPFDIRDMSRAITALSTDDTLCARLSAAGRLRAEAFSWELYKSRVANAYARVMVTKRAAFVKLSGQAATSSWKN